MKTPDIKLFCSGEYLGEVSEMETFIDHGHIRGPEGYVKVREQSLEYATVKITPRPGGQQDVLDTLNGFVRDHEPRDYRFSSEGNIYAIRGILTGVRLGDDGIITMCIDTRRIYIVRSITALAQGTH